MKLNGPVQTLLAATFFMNLGTFAVFTFLAIYLSDQLSFPAIQVGTVLSVLMITSRVLPLFCGFLSDRIGYAVSMVMGMWIRTGGFFYFAIADSFVGTLIAAALTGLGTALYEPAVGAVFSRQEESIRKKGFTYYNQALNAGAILGPLAGGSLMQGNPDWPFLFGGSLYFLIGLMLFLNRHSFKVQTDSAVAKGFLKVFKDRPFLAFNGTMLFFWFMYSQLTILFPLIMFDVTQSKADVSYVVTVNAICGLLLMFLIRSLFEKHAPIVLIQRGMLIMASGLFLCWAVGDKWWILLCVMIFTIGETLVLPASDIKVAEYANNGLTGAYFGLSKISFGIGASAGSFAGPVLMGLQGWDGIPWLVVSAAGVMGSMLTFVLIRGEDGMKKLDGPSIHS
ncbi:MULTISPECIES: MFS transporter [Bacillaceae]|uniref:MFS transporter n=1 Tax=Metabacillus sediminis TaxID=3117746 RepID=A0ABZ2NJ80_9BACI|nr:MFS transporter [Bacillus sp. SJS]KZZ84698.1 hypothetical protein AS29_009185 [Bacillus sp. SJS]